MKCEVEFGHVVTKKVKILDYILYCICYCLKKQLLLQKFKFDNDEE